MRPEKKSQLLLGVTRSKAKMLEYNVPEEHHITITQDPAKLFTISIGLTILFIVVFDVAPGKTTNSTGFFL